jgi:hypothetical protein
MVKLNALPLVLRIKHGMARYRTCSMRRVTNSMRRVTNAEHGI